MTEKKATDVAAAAAAAVETDFAQLMGAGWKRVEQMDAISKAIVARVQEERTAEVQLGLALLQCPTPADAFILYTKWLSQRTTAFMEDAPKLASLWTELYAPKKAQDLPPVPE